MVGTCPYCAASFECEDENYGRKAECYSCGRTFIVGQTPVTKVAKTRPLTVNVNQPPVVIEAASCLVGIKLIFKIIMAIFWFGILITGGVMSFGFLRHMFK